MKGGPTPGYRMGGDSRASERPGVRKESLEDTQLPGTAGTWGPGDVCRLLCLLG